MPERVVFHFDPACPWAWQSARWMWEVEKVRDVTVEWKLYSLKLVNSANPDRRKAAAHGAGFGALRTLALVRRELGDEAMALLYRRIGERVHDAGEGLSRATVEAAVSEAGLAGDFVDRALADEKTIDEVTADHSAAVERAGAFGVPTIIRSSGRGIFGPVLSSAPLGEDAGELWDHVSWLVDRGEFFELKRPRDRAPGATA